MPRRSGRIPRVLRRASLLVAGILLSCAILSCAQPYASSPVSGLWEVTEDVAESYRATFRADGAFLLVFSGTTAPMAGTWTADDVFVELKTWANPKLKFAYIFTENGSLMTFYPAVGGKPIRFRSIAAP